MYVLCSPCILNPALRATGITKPSDIVMFDRAIERCKKFNVEMIPLPCPETLYLGPDRKPGTFLERLNTKKFLQLLDQLEETVLEIIKNRGPPLCIIGVNSSPTCGVTTTFYGGEEDRPAKREGRGVFLDKFRDILAIDVLTFSQYRVYLAAPLFSEAERAYNLSIAILLKKHFFDVYLPQQAGDDSYARNREAQVLIFSENLRALQNADIIIANIDGADADSGTSWEMGYAFAKRKMVVAVRTDFRRSGCHEKVNLMLEESATVVTSAEHLLNVINSPLISKMDSGINLK
jgi:nucleoside 2-deoxyribosyltransferase/predicted secreted protein